MNLDHTIPTRLSEILISKICHDLVSPVGAVNNGIEFLNDMGADGLQDGLGLIDHSARQASVRLQLFRMCYGAGGSDAKTTGKMIYETFQNYVADTKCTMVWDLMNDMPEQDLPAGFLKTLLNMMVFIQESLPKGGMIAISMQDNYMIVTGTGDVVKPKDGAYDALNTNVSTDDITPKSIHGYITRAYAELFGLKITSNIDESTIIIKLEIS